MKCAEIRDLILVGYADKELGRLSMGRIKRHLLKCKHCRRFEVLMLKNVVSPFRHADPVTPPSGVWHNISTIIYEHHEKAQRFLDNIKDDLDSIFSHPVAVTVMTVALVFILVFGVILRPLPVEMQLVNGYLAEQEEFLRIADTGKEVYLGTATEDFIIQGNFFISR
ncbi:MAG: zf-HC2 domain-containing protein [Candidatus Omnitrophota bacterium]|nr:MAG: zf-HC2 domain-containing protein [Candidatus Omnitrophota bacterium]